VVVALHVRRPATAPGPARLTEAEARHVDAIRDERARTAQAASYALRRALLAAELGCAPEAVEFERRCAVCGADGHGKPRVRRPRHAPAFSVSRARDAVAVATSRDGEVGVDVASDQPASVWALLRGRMRHAGDDPITPLAAWTAKEAVLKLIGCGLATPMSEVRLSADGTWETAAHARAGFVTWTAPGGGLLCAVATHAACTVARA